jgi:ectoine hydroxylase-related dioxygenase (phytanoyl-CoA dioxygenase family)
MSSSDQIREKFRENGYFIAKSIISEKKISAVLETIFRIYFKYNPSSKLHDLQEPWNSDLFHEELIKFRKSDPKRFSLLYDSTQTSASVMELLTSELIAKYSANLLDTKNNELCITEGMIRMDAPGDKRNIAGWHQEISYLRNNGLVIWIPLSDITPDLGPLQVCPKSHHEGELKVVQNKNLPGDVSTVSVDEVEPEYIAKYSIMDVEIKKGDVLFFDTELFHRSGVNTSNRIRFSCQIRHAINTAEDFVPFRQTKTYSKSVLDQVIQEHPAFSNNFTPTH